jgi:hypothetical protein
MATIDILLAEDSMDLATPQERIEFAEFVEERMGEEYPYADVEVRLTTALRTTVRATGTHHDEAYIADLVGGPLYSDWLAQAVAS